MIRKTVLVLLLTIYSSIAVDGNNGDRKFSKDFIWGVGSSAYQVEGAWNEDGKSESIWDRFSHVNNSNVNNHETGDVACDSYHLYKQDVQLIKNLGASSYRFSLSWPRILPNGFANKINPLGIAYYNNLIDELLRYNITPFVIIYHWDLPQRLQDIGGWRTPEIIPLYVDYTRVVFEAFGDRVKFWTTFNEPFHICEYGYGFKVQAPELGYGGIADYLCGHNLLKAHAEAVHLYRDNYQSKQQGVIGIVVDSKWKEPKSNSVEDHAAAERSLQFYLGWFAHPIFTEKGGYPQIFIDRIDALSKIQGFKNSRLPKFTEAEIDRIRGTADFFGLNTYSANLISAYPNNTAIYPVPDFLDDIGIIEEYDPSWPTTGSFWLRIAPFGIYKLLKWINKEYNSPIIFITENGVSDFGGTNDLQRIDYHNSYLEATLDAIEDGCDVRGYFAWSLLDSFEWRAGYEPKFGLHHVDLSSPNRKRTPKASVKVLNKIFQTNKIDWTFRPKPDFMIDPPKRRQQRSSASINNISVYGLTFVIFILSYLNLH